jgi:GT2 family glycosyltransferase
VSAPSSPPVVAVASSDTGDVTAGAAVGVVVPVRDDPRLATCLRALAAQTLRPAAVVVVNDGSSAPVQVPADLATDGVTDGPAVTVVRQSPRGSYAARNAGIVALLAQPDPPTYVAFTDADCVPEPDWLEQAVAALESGATAGVVTGPIEVFPRGRRPGAVELYDALTAFPQEEFVQRWGFGATANLVVARSVLEVVGPFRGHLQSGGDAEWGERATAAGHRVVFCDDVVVRHPARATVGELVAKARRTTRGAEQLGRDRGDLPPWHRLAAERLTRPWRGLPALRDERLARVDRLRFLGVSALAHAVMAAEISAVRARWALEAAVRETRR